MNEYPSWRYHKSKPAILVRNPEEDQELSGAWFDSPDCKPAQRVNTGPSPEPETEPEAEIE